MMLELQYQDGTLIISLTNQNENQNEKQNEKQQSLDMIQQKLVEHFGNQLRFDERVLKWRAEGYIYPQLIYFAIENKIPYMDAKSWEKDNDIIHRSIRTPRDYQQGAVDAWWKNRGRGIVVLPTGSGKTFVAELCMAKIARPTLVVAPTLDLVGQWYDLLKVAFQEEIGIVGGGHHDVQRITVTTYDSAHIHLPRYGDRFAFLIFDEVHHLPAPAYLQASRCALAPFRLGLTATLDREDGREALLAQSIGPVVYRRKITDLSGHYLSDYEVVRILVELNDEEKEAYHNAREEYLKFLSEKKINLGYQGWETFIKHAARSKEGRSAFLAYRRAKEISHGSQSKMVLLEDILRKERGKRILIFSNDNQTAYHVSRQYLVPCITHQTSVKERRQLIGAFADGSLPILATSRVLNEGVDIPAAEVAIVLSGTGTVREHVQRLGRILRPSEGKHAILYELVSDATAEKYTSERRRRHDAYR